MADKGTAQPSSSCALNDLISVIVLDSSFHKEVGLAVCRLLILPLLPKTSGQADWSLSS